MCLRRARRRMWVGWRVEARERTGSARGGFALCGLGR